MSSSAETNGETSETMHIDPQRAKVLAENLSSVYQRIHGVSNGRKVSPTPYPHHVHTSKEPSVELTHRKVRLIAVSKLKPAPDILALHQHQPPHLDFGENYAQELTQKAGLLPRSIRWHMIGALQTNKCKPLAQDVPNLYCVSSVDSAKKVRELEKGRKALKERVGAGEDVGMLRVLVQVNTSGEESKSGVDPDREGGKEVLELCRLIRSEECENLTLGGLMTIGAIARSVEASGPDGVNEDFIKLRDVRDKVSRELGVEKEEFELSMGMSGDFEAAIRQGSDEIRVGTGIFGERPAKKDAKIMEERA